MTIRQRIWGAMVLALAVLTPARLPAEVETVGSNEEQIASTAGLLRKILDENIASFWLEKSIDKLNGGYHMHFAADGSSTTGTKAIVPQARTLWLFARLARAGYRKAECLEAAAHGARFLREKMWDPEHGGFYWQVDATGDEALAPNKHLYGQAFGLYALSEYALAGDDRETLEWAIRFFDLLEAHAYDRSHGGYREYFKRDWSLPAEDEVSYVAMVGPEVKLMNTHLHLMEAMTSFYRVSKLPEARERLLELIRIQSSTVVRKTIGACTDKYRRDWLPLLEGDDARVSYGHDIENVWLLMEACEAAGINDAPFSDLYRTLYEYSLRYGYDHRNGGFYDSGEFNRRADRKTKVWWVQSEALVSALRMYERFGDERYWKVFSQTLDFTERYLVDWETGEWSGSYSPVDGAVGPKGNNWKAGYHNGRAMIECLKVLHAPVLED